MSERRRLRLSTLYRHWYAVLGLSVLISLLTLLVDRIPVFVGLEWKTRDLKFQLFPIPERADTNVVLVSVDDNCLEWTRRNRVPWPYPRDFYGLVVNYLSDGGAERIIFDLQFNDTDFDRAETMAEETDGAFASAIAGSGRTILGVQLTPDTTAAPEDLDRFAAQVQGDTTGIRSFPGVLSPIQMFRDSARRLGVINVEPDADGVIRRFPPLLRLGHDLYPQMPLGCLADTLVIHRDRRELSIDGRRIPMDRSGSYLANWYGPGGWRSPFRYYSMGAVLQSAAQHAQGAPEKVSAEAFKGKYVIIGATAGGLMDLKTVPTDRIFPGMEIWATLLSNYLRQDFVRPLPTIWAWFWMFAIVLLTGAIFARFEGRWLYPPLLLLLGFTPVVSLAAFRLYRYDIPVVLPILGFVLAYLITATLYYFMEGRARKEIRAVFSRYLSPDVIQELVQDPDRIEMGGEEINATTLFTDIANFTHISEKFTPHELVTHLNHYFTEFVDIILNHQGLLDKYTGDGLMALFGAPASRPDHAEAACRVALAHKAFCETFPADPEQLTTPQKFHLNTRIGINTASIVAGNIGSIKRIDYTAIGDGVNLAARLEGVNKIYKTRVIISESTWEQVNDKILCRELDRLRVKGKDEPTRVYEVVGEIGDDDGWIRRYEDGLALYRKGEWNAAIASFQTLVDERRDCASAEMIRRCTNFLDEPPLQWDGILNLESK
jgi:adenylate cyclase